MKDLVFVGEHFFIVRSIGREEHLSGLSNNLQDPGKISPFLLPDDKHCFLVRADKDSDSAELLLRYTLLNNSVAGYTGGIVTPPS